MFGIADYGAFCAAILLFLALPGPGTFALLTSTSKGGFRAGAAATAGLILGDQVLLWLAVAGVAALLAAHPTWFKALQYLGAAYLGWIGLRLLLVGYESGNQRILDNIKKGIRLEEAREFTANCKKLGITIHGTFILGLPGETHETIRETIEFAKEVDPFSMQVSLAAP